MYKAVEKLRIKTVKTNLEVRIVEIVRNIPSELEELSPLNKHRVEEAEGE